MKTRENILLKNIKNMKKTFEKNIILAYFAIDFILLMP